jgi:hypothetical protein
VKLQKLGGGFWATFSDRRVKKDIRPYTRGLNEIKQINPVWYKYNELSGYKDTENDYVGIIAQEMEHVLPNTVSEFDDSNNSGISYKKQFNGSEVMWTLVNAVKELTQKIETLEARIKELEKK